MVENTLKLKSREQIVKMQDSMAKASTRAADLRHKAAVQALLHFQRHGDTSLCVRHIELLRQCRGVIVAAYPKWMQKYSPIKFEVTANGVTATKMKPDDKHYVEFNIPEAAANPAEEDPEVKERLNKPMTPIDAKMLRGRLQSTLKMLEDQINGTAKTERTIDGDPDILTAAMKAALVAFEENLKPHVVTEQTDTAELFQTA